MMNSFVTMLWFLSLCIFLVISSAAVDDTKSSRNDEVRNKINDVKQQVNLMFEKAKQRADERKKTATTETVKNIATAARDSAELKKQMNSQITNDASSNRNATSTRMKEVKQQLIGVMGPTDSSQDSSSRTSISTQRVKRTLDAHDIPLAQQR